jgi:excisionase family DNA binding protein
MDNMLGRLAQPRNFELPKEAVLTIAEVAMALGVSRATLYKLMSEDPSFVTFRVRRKRMMRRSALDAWISSQENRDA